MQIMITNGGPHPADKWAEVTTEEILGLIQINENSTHPAAVAARQTKRQLRPVLFDIFNEAHCHVQDHERDALAAEGLLRCSCHLDPTEHVDGVMSKVNEAFAKTPFATHFAKPEVVSVITTIVGKHFANSMHIERCWHADKLEV